MASERKRDVYVFSRYEDNVQRMLNAIQPDSYVRPHLHENKVEIFFLIKGKFLVAEFDDKGNIEDYCFLEKNNIKAVEIQKKTFHTIISLEKDSVVFEIIEGPYSEKDHRVFADWSPENDKEGIKFQEEIKNKIFK